MFLKKKKFKKFQLLLKINFIKNELSTLLVKSLYKNHYNPYLFRLSFIIHKDKKNKISYFSTLQKLVCPFSLIKKVPNKKFSYSRFFLNKKINLLKMNNVYK